MSREVKRSVCTCWTLQSGYFCTVGSSTAHNIHDAWVFCPKKGSTCTSPPQYRTGCKSQTSEGHQSKFSPERDIHNYLFINLRSSTCPSENTRRRNHRTSLQLHASVGVW